MEFRTWHPLWDPCYFCSYLHEHGSSSPDLMGYQPTYGYTALKNRHQQESHHGFKDAIIETGSDNLYISVHARHHTLVIVAVNKKTRQTDAELAYKADFGTLMARERNGDRVPVSPHNQAGAPEFNRCHHRLVNVLCPGAFIWIPLAKNCPLVSARIMWRNSSGRDSALSSAATFFRTSLGSACSRKAEKVA